MENGLLLAPERFPPPGCGTWLQPAAAFIYSKQNAENDPLNRVMLQKPPFVLVLVRAEGRCKKLSIRSVGAEIAPWARNVSNTTAKVAACPSSPERGHMRGMSAGHRLRVWQAKLSLPRCRFFAWGNLFLCKLAVLVCVPSSLQHTIGYSLICSKAAI